jgi:hypothetical protein
MNFEIIRQKQNGVTIGLAGQKGPFGHCFGGKNEYGGLQAFRGQPSAHLLFRLNTEDDAVGVQLPKAKWLPLLCAIRYGACELAYQVLSDDSVKIISQSEKTAWPDFPFKDFPDELRARPVNLVAVEYDPNDVEIAFQYAAIFPPDQLTPKQLGKLVKYVEKNDLWLEMDSEYDTIEGYVLHGIEMPFVQGPPKSSCPNRSCSQHAAKKPMRVFAIFQEGWDTCHKLWGPNGEDLQIIYEICPKCQTIQVSNQCT